jgi:hypothetical protein
MTSTWRAAVRSRSGGQTSRLTSRPTTIPISVSSSRAPERRRVDPEHRPGGEREQHAEERRGDLLRAARERAIDGGVHRQQRRPRREERLREPEDRARHHPCEHGGARGLDEQERVAPHHGVPEPIARGAHRPGMPAALSS